MSKRGITRQQVTGILRDLRTSKKNNTKPDIQGIARMWKVQPSTVKSVRQAGSWFAYELRRGEKAKSEAKRKAAAKKLEKKIAGKSARPELVTTPPVRVKFHVKPPELPTFDIVAFEPPTKRPLKSTVAKRHSDDDTFKQLLADVKTALAESAKANQVATAALDTANEAKQLATDALKKQKPLIKRYNDEIAAGAVSLSKSVRSRFGFGRKR